MALFKITDRYPDYKDRFFGGHDVKGSAVYTHAQHEKVGSIRNVLVDEADQIRYLVVSTGPWVFSKNVLLPIGCCVDQPNRDRSYITDLTKSQVHDLPEYKDEMVAHPNDAAQSNGKGQTHWVNNMTSVEDSVPVELSVPVEEAGLKGYIPLQSMARPTHQSTVIQPDIQPHTESTMPAKPNGYNQEPDLHAANDPNHHRVQLYEERLVADKYQQKAGEVTISKRVETTQTETNLPLRKEKIIIEIESVGGVTRVNTPNGNIQNGESVHMDVYGEQANLRKEPVVYQDVNIRKEVATDVVTARETLRREKLDVQSHEAPDATNRSHRI